MQDTLLLVNSEVEAVVILRPENPNSMFSPENATDSEEMQSENMDANSRIIQMPVNTETSYQQAEGRQNSLARLFTMILTCFGLTRNGGDISANLVRNGSINCCTISKTAAVMLLLTVSTFFKGSIDRSRGFQIIGNFNYELVHASAQYYY